MIFVKVCWSEINLWSFPSSETSCWPAEDDDERWGRGGTHYTLSSDLQKHGGEWGSFSSPEQTDSVCFCKLWKRWMCPLHLWHISVPAVGIRVMKLRLNVGLSELNHTNTKLHLSFTETDSNNIHRWVSSSVCKIEFDLDFKFVFICLLFVCISRFELRLKQYFRDISALYEANTEPRWASCWNGFRFQTFSVLGLWRFCRLKSSDSARKWSFDTLKDSERQETLSSFSLNHFLLGCFSPWTHNLIWQSEPHCWFYRVYMFDFSETVCVDWTDDEIWSNLNSFQRKTLISL